jgi:hypothetical protein
MVYNSCLEVQSKAPDKGKPLERVGRKATGLRPADAGYGRRAPGRLPFLIVEERRARAHQKEGCAYATRINSSHVLPRLSCHSAPGISSTARSGVIGSSRHRMACVLRQATPPVETGGVHPPSRQTRVPMVLGRPESACNLEKVLGVGGRFAAPPAPLPYDRRPTHG